MQYKGLNRIHLMYASTDFNESRWLTFKQTQQMKSKGRKESIDKQILFLMIKKLKLQKKNMIKFVKIKI
ncbi:ArdC-like ssDNA-binding domain-containing protein [Malacoplasma muris]|uniref:ArdC-like ssDNA-binding domain-containing protein n=1 Tax=Malacoplasma muris TaxID=2119 RepID=UPI00398E83DA